MDEDTGPGDFSFPSFFFSTGPHMYSKFYKSYPNDKVNQCFLVRLTGLITFVHILYKCANCLPACLNPSTVQVHRSSVLKTEVLTSH